MAFTVSNLYKLAMTLERDSEVIELHQKYNSTRSKKNQISLSKFVIDCINYASLTDNDSLFENDSLILSTYNGRIYYIGEEDGIEKNKYISDETLRKHKLTEAGKKFIKKYLPTFDEKQVVNNRPQKNAKNSKKTNKEKTEKKDTAKNNTNEE